MNYVLRDFIGNVTNVPQSSSGVLTEAYIASSFSYRWLRYMIITVTYIRKYMRLIQLSNNEQARDSNIVAKSERRFFFFFFFFYNLLDTSFLFFPPSFFFLLNFPYAGYGYITNLPDKQLSKINKHPCV